MKRNKRSKKTVYGVITDKILGYLRDAEASGESVPWRRSWKLSALPVRQDSNVPYRGINQIMLQCEAWSKGYSGNRWFTVKQAEKLGAKLRDGVSRRDSAPVVWWNTTTVYERDEDGELTDVVKGEWWTPRFYSVFNEEQFDGIEALEREELPEFERHSHAESTISNTNAEIIYGGDRASYSPHRDTVQMPEPEKFTGPEQFYSVMFHELGHWTGHGNRLDRDLSGTFGGESYAAEELVAELTSAFLCSDHQITGDTQHPQYIHNWIKLLENNEKAIMKASSLAASAAEYINDGEGNNEVEEEDEVQLPFMLVA